ncbi:MAG: class I SAM-dependent methyltransferase [Blastocatellia bacterium]|nr:class I SAM-dependent methyltransferase [Blastocatellia bacterium]
MGSDEKSNYFGRDLEAMSFAINYHNWIISEFKQYFGETIAEVGAGTGNFTQLLIAANHNIRSLVAFEPSANMYPLLEERLSATKQVKTVNGFFGAKESKEQEQFDSILYINVLEHIENDAKEMFHAYNSLKTGGYVLIFVPALRYLYSEFDKQLGHYRRYHKKQLIDLVESVGFRVVKAKYFDLVGIIPWYIAFVLLKRSMSSGNVLLYDKLVVPVMQHVEKVLTPFVGKNLLLVGRKG